MKKLNIALVAHDGRKQEMLEWVRYNVDKLSQHNLYATGTTGRLIENLGSEERTVEVRYLDGGYPDEITHHINGPLYGKVTKLLSGPLGGDAQIGAMIASGVIDCLIFFCDNLAVQGHQNDIQGLSRLASLYNIAFATNRTTADMILTSPLFESDDYERIIPKAIENYQNRKL